MGCENSKHMPSPFKDTHTASASASSVGKTHDAPAKRRIIQNFILIWLDADIDETNDAFRHSMAQLRRIVNTIDVFTDPNRCVDYLTGVKDEKVLIIVSGALEQHTLLLIHDMSQLSAMFVFCGDKARYEQWARQWPKVKGVFTEIGPICDALKQTARQCDQDTIPISFVSMGEVPGENLDQLDQSYMYTKILKDVLLEMEYDQQSIKDFTAYCRRLYAENDLQLTHIAKFDDEYGRHKSPIWWYTYDCFLYPTLNRALRNQELDTIIKVGFFIRDLHRHIAELHAEQFEDQQIPPFIVYRGQGLPIPDFEKLTKMNGGLMSFNNFVSTSRKREVSLDFGTHASKNPELVGILFKMTIDPSTSNIPFADIRGVNDDQLEEEILFSMHTVFRIGNTKKLDSTNRLWQVELTLTGDNDPLLSALTKKMQEETEGSFGWDRLGKLLYKVGAFAKAEQVYRVLLDQQTSSNRDKASYYNNLGQMKDEQGDYIEAILLYKKALEIEQKTLPPNHPDLASSYSNIGVVYSKMNEYSKAFSFYGRGLEIRQKTLPPDHPDLATSYNNLGEVYRNMGEYSKALSFYEKTHEILEKSLPPNHPDLATFYNNLGEVYRNMGEYSKALSFYEKSHEILQKTLPPNHPDLATSYNNIGLVNSNMGEYSKALSSHKKALEIYQETLPPNHPSLATSYNNIGSVYPQMGEYLKALSSHEKALEIYQKTLSPNHPLLCTCYNNIGEVYRNIGEYSKALSSHKKALEIQQKTLPPNHPDLVISYNNIGSVYYTMKDYSKALPFFERALDIFGMSLPPTHPQLQTLRQNIEIVKQKL